MRRLAVIAGAALAIVILLVAAWQLDVRRHHDEAMRNVTVAGQDVSGASATDVKAAVDDLARRYAASTVALHTPDGDRTIAAADIGLEVDTDATVKRVLDTGHDDALPLRWLRSIVTDREAGVVTRTDPARLRFVVAANDPTGRREPKEPGITGKDGTVAVVLGADGQGLDAVAVGNAIERAANGGDLPIAVDVESTALHPRFTRADAEKLAADARARTKDAIAVTAGAASGEITPEHLRSWVTSAADGDALRLTLDPDTAVADLRTMLPTAGTSPTDARFDVSGGRPVILPGVKGTACCRRDAIAELEHAVMTGDRGPVVLPLTTIDPEKTSAHLEQLGIVEEVGSFTTKHKCCENRVQNIHRIADLVRGVVIPPGGTFSVNDHVGKRTTDKGFVIDHVIENGSFAEAVGGGISQFATTTFNAAFFAGLDLKEYQSHSIYISRYPYGREATLSWPKPDLVIGNRSPYGVLIWPTYTNTSLTVTMYSTRFARGEQTAQSEAPVGPNGCVRVTTERTRTFVDGTVKKDKVYATYRPSEGVQCS